MLPSTLAPYVGISVCVCSQNLESRLKVLLPDDVGAALMDGVVLCHLANHIRPRSVASIHVPSPAVPKLSMAKCRRNVENFLDACKKLGVPQVGSSVSSLYKCMTINHLGEHKRLLSKILINITNPKRLNSSIL
uniref:Calponin-homology (CH) domain-containing protein n=1 Tax=Sinocyclocheilus grahami TaxID=75366 RepID=A0A672P9K2_SINGR